MPTKKTILIILSSLLLLSIAGLVVGGEEKNRMDSSANYLRATAPPFLIEGEVLPALMEANPELIPIIKCESGFRNVCNAESCRYGIGVCQIVQSTADYCSEKLGEEIDPYDPMDNIRCANWLFENEGLVHWEQSAECWDK